MAWFGDSSYNGVPNVPFSHTNSGFAAGAYVRYGYGGDVVPGARHAADTGAVLGNVTVRNLGADTLAVSADQTWAAFNAEFYTVPAASAIELPGQFGSVHVWNNGSAIGTYSIGGTLVRKPTGPAANVANHPGHAMPLSASVTANPGGAVTADITAPAAMTLTQHGLWAVGAPTTAGTYTLTINNVTTGVSLLDSPPVDLTALVAQTESNPTITAVVADRSIAKGDVIRLTATSDNGDLTAGDFLYLMTATWA